MKKRVLCLIIALVMVLPLVLASCDGQKTPEEIANEIFNAENAKIALTLSLYIPTDSDTESTDFKLRLLAVENAINDILISEKKLSTKIKIEAIKDSDYEKVLTEKLNAVKEAEKTKGSAYNTADGYVNIPKKNPETGVYELSYPDVLDTQLDLFLVRGYDNLVSFVNSEDAMDISSLFSDGQIHQKILKLIREPFMSQMKINGSYYAIPNNHIYATNAQYLVLNKELFDSYSTDKIEDIKDIYAIENYIKLIASSKANDEKLASVIPYFANMEDVPGIIYYDKANLIAGTVLDATPNSVYNIDMYNQYVGWYKQLQEANIVKSSLAENEIAAAKIVYGDANTLAELRNDNYVIELTAPYANIEDIYASMFAISTHSANPDRAMEVLTLLQNNTEIRTLLQYGIEDVDYTINSNNQINISTDTAYKMNLLYTGNQYYTYSGEGATVDEWDVVKEFNGRVLISPFFKLQQSMYNGKLSAEDRALLEQYLNGSAPITKAIATELSEMSYAEFIGFNDVADFDKEATIKKITTLQATVASDEEEAAFYRESLKHYEDNESMIEMIMDTLERTEKRIAENKAELETLNAQLEMYENCIEFIELTKNSAVYSNLVTLYQKLYKQA